MLVLQILLVPFVVLLLLSAVFVIGTQGVDLPRRSTLGDQPFTRVDKSETDQMTNSVLPATPVTKL
jgi:hypothetical protein